MEMGIFKILFTLIVSSYEGKKDMLVEVITNNEYFPETGDNRIVGRIGADRLDHERN